MAIRRALVLLTILGVSACQSISTTYPTDDSLRKGEALDVPREFQNGTATLDQAKAWSNSLLEGTGPIATEEHELIPNGKTALFICDESNAGTGGNFYLVFDRTRTGLQYLGEIDFGTCCAVPPDAMKNPRLVTYWGLGASEGTLTLWVLTKSGFTEEKSITIHAGDNGTDEGTRIYEEFFESKRVANGTVAAVFGGP
jgi:hypothetical protein